MLIEADPPDHETPSAEQDLRWVYSRLLATTDKGTKKKKVPPLEKAKMVDVASAVVKLSVMYPALGVSAFDVAMLMVELISL